MSDMEIREAAIHDAEWRIGSYIANGGKQDDKYVIDQIEKIRDWSSEVEG